MDKAEFCKELAWLLGKTERYSDLVGLEYSVSPDEGEFVTPLWWDSVNQKRFRGKKIDVTADSERAIVLDVLHSLG